jgi:hypothetical protein
MMDTDKVWLVPEKEEEIEKAKNLIGNPDDYTKIEMPYLHLKELFKLDYIQIGNYGGYDNILGYVELYNLKLEINGFEPKVTIDNKYFKPFIKYLIKGLKLRFNDVITFYYAINRLVVVEVEGKKGLIAYCGE